MADDLFDSTGLKQIFQMMLDQNMGRQETLANNAATDDILKVIREVAKNSNKITEKEVDKISKTILGELRNMFGGSAALTSYIKLMAELLKEIATSKKGLNETQMTNRIIAAMSNMFQASYDAKRSGQGTIYVNYDSKKAQGDLGAQKLVATFIPQSLVKINTTIEKILNFFNVEKSQEKVKTRHFIDDLVEGLGRSKFVGGALIDLIRLATFFAANWLKQFGPIGKALAVGLVALGPIIGAKIADMLIKGLVGTLTNVLKAGMVGLGTLLKGVFLSFANKSLMERAMTSPMTGGFRGNLALGSFLAAGALGVTAVNTWREGKKGAGLALGAGSAAFGVAGIASLLAPFFPLLAPIAPIALAVGAVASGIGLIVKFWPQIMEFFKGILEWLGIIAKKDEDGNYITQAKSVGQAITGYGGQSKIARLEGKGDREWNKANTAALQVSDTGLLMNTGELTQENLSKQVSEFVGNSTDSDNFKKLEQNYDFIRADNPHVSAGSFQTDAVTEIDGVKYIIAPKGTLDRLENMDAQAAALGIDSITQLTGGIGTAGNYATRTASPHKGKEHFKPVDAAIDFVSKDRSGNVITDELNKRGVIKSIWGKDAFVHDAGSGLHAHMEKYASAEGQENWDIYQKGSQNIYMAKNEPIYEAAKKSIAIKEQEINEINNKIKQADEKDQNALIKERRKLQSELIDMKLDAGEIEKQMKKGSLDITAMNKLRRKMATKTFQDLIDKQAYAQTEDY